MKKSEIKQLMNPMMEALLIAMTADPIDVRPLPPPTLQAPKPKQ